MTEKSEANLLPAFCKKDQNIQTVRKIAHLVAVLRLYPF